MSDQSTTYIRALGRYHVLDELGRGAMAIVYRGFDPVIGRTVALKTMAFEGADTESNELRQRLHREASAAGTLAHPNIVTIYDIIEEGGTTAVAMEFIEGQTLAALIAERAPLPVDQALEIFEQIAAGLDYPASKGIVHRDVKPANIMLTGDGRVKVADFGVARIAVSTMTQTGTVVGSPSYMSPEQVRGQALDGRSDMFSAAVVLYELLTRERPFAGDDVATTMYRIVHEPPTEPATFNAAISPGLAQVIRRALAKTPDERYRTGPELVQELRRAMSLASLPDPSTVAPAPVPASPSRGRMKLYLAAGVPIALLLGLVVFGSRAGKKNTVPPPEATDAPAVPAASLETDAPAVPQASSAPAPRVPAPPAAPAAVSTVPSAPAAVSTIPSSAGAVSTIPDAAGAKPAPPQTPGASRPAAARESTAARSAAPPAGQAGPRPEAAAQPPAPAQAPAAHSEASIPRVMPGAAPAGGGATAATNPRMATLRFAFDGGAFPLTVYVDGRQLGRIEDASSRLQADPGRPSIRVVNESFFFDHDFGSLALEAGENRVLAVPATASAYIGVRGDSYSGLRVTLDGRELPGPYPAQLPRIAATRHRLSFKWSSGVLSGVEVSDTIDLTGGRQFSIRAVPDNGQVVVQKLR